MGLKQEGERLTFLLFLANRIMLVGVKKGWHNPNCTYCNKSEVNFLEKGDCGYDLLL